jgi:hypothetical protein
MRIYLSSTSARLARIVLALAAFACGAVALAGREAGIYVIAATPPILIVGGLVSIGLAIREHGLAALGLTFALPFVAGPYVGLLYAARGFGPTAGLALAAAGVAIFAGTVVNPLLRLPPRERRAQPGGVARPGW